MKFFFCGNIEGSDKLDFFFNKNEDFEYSKSGIVVFVIVFVLNIFNKK